MNTLKNYLESMFAHMPNSPEVLKAKDELWQMMEDKYNELISDGKNENEAVGTIISEFGNLEELSEELGLKQEFEDYNPNADSDYVSYEEYERQEEQKKEEQRKRQQSERKVLSFEEAKTCVDDHIQHGFYIAIGVMLCIFSPIMPILSDTFKISDAIGITGMMILIGIAVFMFVYSSTMVGKWNFIKEEPCMIDYNTSQVLQNEKARFRGAYAIRQTVGIVLCVLCWLPVMIIGETPLGKFDTVENLGAVSLFVLVGIGVMLIVYSNMTNAAYDDLLKINDKKLVSGNYVKTQKSERYINDTVTTIMQVYWPTITGIYLIWSFLSFEWYRTWIIWPIAGIIKAVIDANLREKE